MFVWLIGCYSTTAVLIEDEIDTTPGDGWVDEVPRGDDPDDPDPVDWSQYDGAVFRILSPAAGELVAMDTPVDFEAELISADGDVLDADVILWSTSASEDWDNIGPAFADDRLPLGLQDLTAVAELPNGDRLTYTAGGIKVQHPFGGTYAGFFSSSGSVQGFSFVCSGAARIATGPVAEAAVGNGNCTASLIVFDLPLDWVFQLEVDPAAGTVSGTAGAAILGPFTYDFNGSGVISETQTTFAWSGTVPFIQFEVNGNLVVDRVSDDTL